MQHTVDKDKLEVEIKEQAKLMREEKDPVRAKLHLTVHQALLAVRSCLSPLTPAGPIKVTKEDMQGDYDVNIDPSKLAKPCCSDCACNEEKHCCLNPDCLCHKPTQPEPIKHSDSLVGLEEKAIKPSECDCASMSCTKDCQRNHTHKEFFCEKCKPSELVTVEELITIKKDKDNDYKIHNYSCCDEDVIYVNEVAIKQLQQKLNSILPNPSLATAMEALEEANDIAVALIKNDPSNMTVTRLRDVTGTALNKIKQSKND